MSEPPNIVSQLQELHLLICHYREQAEAKIVQVNQVIRCIGDSGLLYDTVICGPIILQRNYSPVRGGHDSGEVVQAVLHVPHGIGIVRWNSDELANVHDVPEALESQACRDFVPFEQCEPVAKALLWPHIEPLLGELRARIT